MGGFEAAFAQHERNAKIAVMHNTWGHLFPKGKHYKGKLRIAFSEYSDMDNAIIDEKIDFDSSPWWYNTVTDFAFDIKKDIGAKAGEVWEVDISVDIVKEPDEGEQEAYEQNEAEKDGWDEEWEWEWEPYEMKCHERMVITRVGSRKLVEAWK